MILPETVEAALAGRTIRAGVLTRFDFASRTERVFGGHGSIYAGGYEWKGMGKFGSVDGLTTRSDLAAVPLTFTLSGVDPDMVTLAKNSAHEVTGRSCCVYFQFFSEDWQVLDQPLAIRSAIMDVMRYEATGPAERNITLTAEGLFASRRAAPFAFYTDPDQQARFPGDRAFELMPSLVAKVVTWPDY